MAPMRATLALSTLCENPRRRTGLSTLFREFVAHARRLHPDVSWLVFCGPGDAWEGGDPGVEVCRAFPSNERPAARLLADHLGVAAAARRRGAAALVTVGFCPVLTAGLPVIMQVFAAGDRGTVGTVRSLYRNWAVARGLSRAALVITNSSWAKAALGPGAAPVIVSPEGLRHDLFRPEGPRGASAVAGRYFLWASNLYPYKRVELALAAYAGLAPARRSEFPLVVVGGDWHGCRARAQAEAERLGIRGSVYFLGWVEDEELPSLYRGALAHILSTAHETFGRSVLESMACGCPCVVQDLEVLREVAGECALFVDFADTRAATAAMERVCADEALRARLGAAGAERSLQFSFERLARERMGAILDRLGLGAP